LREQLSDEIGFLEDVIDGLAAHPTVKVSGDAAEWRPPETLPTNDTDYSFLVNYDGVICIAFYDAHSQEYYYSVEDFIPQISSAGCRFPPFRSPRRAGRERAVD
jgi:hypothetical protein